ncbi:hypothetical protein EVAR_51681_1 [Eumeta japonica]|uniref:Uncharacterized protein n=1 Tax=Eumeta variegata TaxID=151549 RepID=A0A4C1Y3A6_EUMVA|nr:hypothetical protein EVAR_51681_1 [Eumeta japonica]
MQKDRVVDESPATTGEGRSKGSFLPHHRQMIRGGEIIVASLFTGRKNVSIITANRIEGRRRLCEVGIDIDWGVRRSSGDSILAIKFRVLITNIPNWFM